MWSLQRWRMRKKLRSTFLDYLSNEIIDELVNRPAGHRRPPEPTELCFILLQVRDDRIHQVPVYLAKACEIITRRQGCVWSAMSSMAIATFGLPFSDDPEKDKDRRAKSVARLMTELDPDIRLVYGTMNGLLGSYGDEARSLYGPLLPDFPRHVSTLLALEFGQSAEVPVT
ncbi:hypothetical protein [Dongia deserti]|uniref:hypothetical protein n=1 Tax=Dongia deserti TaxID=2268030 RepID=UPI0013C3FC18|nr:hypothetical protein [Dongia deserti]